MDLHDTGLAVMGLGALYELEDIMWKSSTCDLALIACIISLAIFAVAVYRS